MPDRLVPREVAPPVELLLRVADRLRQLRCQLGDEVVEKLAAKLPQTTRYAKQQLNFWRDLSWHETVNHARDWLALSMLGDEAKGAIQGFLERT